MSRKDKCYRFESFRCAETFTKERIVSAMQRQISWSHIKIIMWYIKGSIFLKEGIFKKLTLNDIK